MKKNAKHLFISAIIIMTFFIAYVNPEEKIDEQLWQKALTLQNEAIVIDTHCDTPMLMMERGLDIGQKNDISKIDLVRMKEGGVDAAFFVVYISNDEDDKHPSKHAFEIIDEIYNQVEKNSGLAELAFSPQDIRRIHKTGKRAILIAMENGGPIEGSLRLLRDYYRLGVRYMSLTHNENNDLSDSSNAKEAKWNGLSETGKKAIEEMNRLGMMIDVSHLSDDAFFEIIKLSKAPIIASHSSVRSLCDVPRNMSDEMIKLLAKNGGTIQINFYSGFLDNGYSQKSDEVRKTLAPEIEKLKEKYKDHQADYWNAFFELWKKHAPEPPDIEILINHIDYAVKLVGADHVGLGSDFDGAGSYPLQLKDVSNHPLIAYHLIKRGYSEEDIKKILGGNLLRVFDEVIKTAKTLQKEKQ